MVTILQNLLSQARSQALPLSVLYLPIMLTLLIVEYQGGVPVSTFTRDANAVTGMPFYTGALSNLGILFWCATAAICLFTAGVTGQRIASSPIHQFLLWSGCLTLFLMLDDLLMLHEEVFPFILMIPEWIVLAIYGLAGLALVIAFSRVILNSDYIGLVLAGGFFALSLLFDAIPSSTLPFFWRLDPYLCEDGCKLLGIVGWFGYFCRLSYQMLRVPYSIARGARRRTLAS